MICTRVRALIDAAPFAQYRPPQLAAAERHARGCSQCRPALEAAKALDTELSRLPEPTSPVALAAIVIARTARLDEAGAIARRDPERVDTRGDWSAWAAVLAGVAVVLGAHLYAVLAGESTLDFTSSRLGGWVDGLGELPRVGPVVMVAAAGLLLSLAGLFGTVRGASAPDRPPAER